MVVRCEIEPQMFADERGLNFYTSLDLCDLCKSVAHSF